MPRAVTFDFIAAGFMHGACFLDPRQRIIWLTTANAGCEGQMDELIGRRVATVVVDRAAAQRIFACARLDERRMSGWRRAFAAAHPNFRFGNIAPARAIMMSDGLYAQPGTEERSRDTAGALPGHCQWI
jgi:hypothetical protein